MAEPQPARQMTFSLSVFDASPAASPAAGPQIWIIDYFLLTLQRYLFPVCRRTVCNSIIVMKKKLVGRVL